MMQQPANWQPADESNVKAVYRSKLGSFSLRGMFIRKSNRLSAVDQGIVNTHVTRTTGLRVVACFQHTFVMCVSVSTTLHTSSYVA